MHTLTVQTKYTFGDRILFNSRMQGRKGTGRILAITIDDHGQIHYMIEVDRVEDSDIDVQAGILEHEITPL